MSSTAFSSPPDPDRLARWSERVLALCLAWRDAPGDEERSRILSELWVLVNAALSRYVRLHSQSCGAVDPEEVRDIASEKALAFLRNLEAGSRDLDRLQAPQVSAYVSVLARNGLVDRLRRSRRGDGPLHPRSGTPIASPADDADVGVRHQQFLNAILQCVACLPPRAQDVWFFRVFLDMPSKKIAAHPDVRMTSTAVDMLFSRTRRSLRACMEKKGFNSDDAPPGTFVALWEMLHDRGHASEKEGQL